MPATRVAWWTVALKSLLCGVLLSAARGAEPVPTKPTAAQERRDEAVRRLDEARAALEAARRRVEELERALAEAERGLTRETVDRARRGDAAALDAVLDQLSGPAQVVDFLWSAAVSGPEVDSAAVVERIGRRWASASDVARCKLCWLLGQNGSDEAGRLLRDVLTRASDAEKSGAEAPAADIAAAALVALRRCPREAADRAILRRYASDDRRIEVAIGYFPRSTVGELASGWLAELEPNGQATIPGEVEIEPATLHCVGLEWRIDGDTNQNCTVAVRYRREGAGEWRTGFPLLRCENRPHPDYEVHPGNLLAGSLFDLEPATAYEVELTLDDPDGGQARRTLTVRTRAVPGHFEGERVLHVVPGEGGGSGTEDDPLRGLAGTFPVARPGDVFLLAPGTYRGVESPLRTNGEPGRPIVYRGAERGRVIIDGQGLENCLEVKERKHIHIEDLSFTGARIPLSASATEYLVVRRCRFADYAKIGMTVSGDDGRTSRFAYIADNVILGQAEWPRGRRQSTYGLLLSGEGHVVCHNLIADHWDGMTLSYGKGQGRPPGRSIDIYQNDIRQCVDDGIEADYVHHNVRIFRNRLVNTFSSISFQPIYGGPGYIWRNAMYNTTNKPFKLHVHPSGIVIAHNTCLTSREAFYGGNFHNALVRNNVILGLAGEQGYWLSTQADGLDLDHNGFNVAAPARPLIKLNNVRYATMAALTDDLGLQAHAVAMDWSSFPRVTEPPGQTVTVDPQAVDLRPRADSPAVDAGTALPGLSDGFTGAAPDLGCYERGVETPHYGPRPAEP